MKNKNKKQTSKMVKYGFIGAYIIIFLFLTSTAFSVTTVNGGVRYLLDTANLTAEVGGESYDSSPNVSVTGAKIIPPSITYNGQTYTVIGLGKNAFRNASGLTGVTIPNTVTKIGDSAFYWCESLASVTIPNTVTSIGNYAFRDCISLTSVTLSGVTSIGIWAFDGCVNLKSVTIPNGVTIIEEGTFLGCESLVSVTIPDSVITIGDRAFEGCIGLPSVEIPSSVKTIGDRAFHFCMSFTTMTIPDSVTRIGEDAFTQCVGLIQVTVSKSVTSIGNQAFYNCYLLKDVFFQGVPPRCEGPNVAFYFLFATGAKGYYLPEYQEQWKAVIGSDGKWQGLIMGPAKRYTITTTTSPAMGGTTSGGGLKELAGYCTVTATPGNCYTFVNWVEGAIAVSSSANYTFLVTGNRTLTANFKVKQYTITTTASAGGIASGGGLKDCGSSCTVTATANDGYSFANWTEGDSVVSTSASFTVPVMGDRMLVANFAPSYTITTKSNPMEGGSTSGGGQKKTGDSCTVTALSNSGYTFENWMEDDVVVSFSANYTFTVAGNRTLTANFSMTPYIKEILIENLKNPFLPKDKNFQTENELQMTALIEENSAYEIVKVTWAGADIGPVKDGNPTAVQYAAGKHGEKTITATLYYKHKVSGLLGSSREFDKKFKLFFEQIGIGTEPNWFKYWGRDGACPNLKEVSMGGNTLKIVYRGSLPINILGKMDVANKTVLIGSGAAGSAPLLNSVKSGINLAENVCVHEQGHYYIRAIMYPLWHNALQDSDAGINPNGFYDKKYNDHLPDVFEMDPANFDSFPTPNPYDTDTFDLKEILKDYAYYGDEEYYVRVRAERNARAVPSKDWANPGAQTEPTSGIFAEFNARPPSSINGYGEEVPEYGEPEWEDLLSAFQVISCVAPSGGSMAKYKGLQFDVQVRLTEMWEGCFLTGWLVGSDSQPVAWASVELEETDMLQNMTLSFPGELLAYSRIDGPYLLKQVIIQSGSGILMGVLKDTCLTDNYLASDFTPPAAMILGDYSEAASATGGLNISLDVSVENSGTYAVEGYLFDESGTDFVFHAIDTRSFATGTTRITLNFPADALFQSKVAGKFLLKTVKLLGEEGALDQREDSYFTQSYGYQTFGAADIAIVPTSFSDEMVTAGENGSEFGVGVAFRLMSQYHVGKQCAISVSLLTPNGSLISRASINMMVHPGNNDVSLFFPGTDIFDNAQDGPYSVSVITVFAEDGKLEDMMYSSYWTDAYSYLDFGNGEGTILDVTGSVDISTVTWSIDRSTGALVATFTMVNNGQKPLENAFWYAIEPTARLKLATISGYTGSGLTYVDVTDQVEAQLPSIGNGDMKLDMGESVTFTVSIYSADRSIPTGYVYAIWADPPVSIDMEKYTTRSTPVPIPFSWLAAHFPGLVTDVQYNDAATNLTQKGVPAWQEYVTGTDPNDPNDFFILTGAWPNLRWVPNLGTNRRYTVEGLIDITDKKGWYETDLETDSTSRYFRVKVQMP